MKKALVLGVVASLALCSTASAANLGAIWLNCTSVTVDGQPDPLAVIGESGPGIAQTITKGNLPGVYKINCEIRFNSAGGLMNGVSLDMIGNGETKDFAYTNLPGAPFGALWVHAIGNNGGDPTNTGGKLLNDANAADPSGTFNYGSAFFPFNPAGVVLATFQLNIDKGLGQTGGDYLGGLSSNLVGFNPPATAADTIMVGSGSATASSTGPNPGVDNSLILSVVNVPEPATLALLGLGGLALIRRRR